MQGYFKAASISVWECLNQHLCWCRPSCITVIITVHVHVPVPDPITIAIRVSVSASAYESVFWFLSLHLSRCFPISLPLPTVCLADMLTGVCTLHVEAHPRAHPPHRIQLLLTVFSSSSPSLLLGETHVKIPGFWSWGHCSPHHELCKKADHETGLVARAMPYNYTPIWHGTTSHASPLPRPLLVMSHA